MAAITISRQLGSKGAKLGQALARELGWQYADKSTINKVIRQYGLIRLDDLYDKPPRLRELFRHDSQLTIEMMNQTVAAIAARGDVVILLRGGFVVTKGLVDVLNIFVKAPLEIRVARIATRDDLDPEVAAEKVKQDDKQRRKFAELYYDTDWTDPEGYDLVVNTKNLSTSEAVAKVVEAYRGLPSRAVGAPMAAGFEIDPVLAETVDEVMGRAAAHS